jgi:hypothetical protein
MKDYIVTRKLIEIFPVPKVLGKCSLVLLLFVTASFGRVKCLEMKKVKRWEVDCYRLCAEKRSLLHKTGMLILTLGRELR